MNRRNKNNVHQLAITIASFFGSVFFRESFGRKCVSYGSDKLNESENAGRIILIGTPEYPNIGDQAIAMASVAFFNEFFPEYQIIEITNEQLFPENRGEWINRVKSKDVIAVSGGGYMGDVWSDMSTDMLETIRLLKHNKIIMMPQTFYYRDKETEAAEMKELMDMENVLILHRGDKKESRLIECEKNKIFCPDMCLYFPVQRKRRCRLNKSILCLRSDKESLLEDSSKRYIEETLQKNNLAPIYTDNVVDRIIGRSERGKEVKYRMYVYAHAGLIVTDRLHTMIFAYLSHTPCIAINSLTGKTEAMYEWIKKSERIAYINDIETEFNSDTIRRVMKGRADMMQFPEIKQSFEDMASIIRRHIESEDR